MYLWYFVFPFPLFTDVYKKWAIAMVLYLNLDLVTELLQVVHKLLSRVVRNSEYHLQPCPPSRSSSHPHAKVVLWLKLHISLDKTRTIMSMAKIAAANQIKRQQRWGSRGKAETKQTLVLKTHSEMDGHQVWSKSNTNDQWEMRDKNRSCSWYQIQEWKSSMLGTSMCLGWTSRMSLLVVDQWKVKPGSTLPNEKGVWLLVKPITYTGI